MPQNFSRIVGNEDQLYAISAEITKSLHPGDIVLLEGPLGAGKTTFVRGILHDLGYQDIVRSPTFNLIQTFETKPPIMHADLYRVESAEGIGLEDYLETHVCLIEWGDRTKGWINPDDTWKVKIDFAPEGRFVQVIVPKRPF